MLTAPRMVRTERAVRPLLADHLAYVLRRHSEFQDGILIPVHGFHFHGFRLIHQGPRNFADQFIYVHRFDLGHDLAPDLLNWFIAHISAKPKLLGPVRLSSTSPLAAGRVDFRIMAPKYTCSGFAFGTVGEY